MRSCHLLSNKSAAIVDLFLAVFLFSLSPLPPPSFSVFLASSVVHSVWNCRLRRLWVRGCVDVIHCGLWFVASPLCPLWWCMCMLFRDIGNIPCFCDLHISLFGESAFCDFVIPPAGDVTGSLCSLAFRFIAVSTRYCQSSLCVRMCSYSKLDKITGI